MTLRQNSNNNSLEKICKNNDLLHHQIFEWIVRGENEVAIIEALSENLKPAQIKAVIGEVYGRFFDLMQSDPAQIYGWTLAAAKSVYQKMYKIGDFAGCLKAIKEIRSIAEKMGEPAAPPKTKKTATTQNLDLSAE